MKPDSKDPSRVGSLYKSMVSKNSLQNLKQNQNLFLSFQSKNDKIIRWKYTLLVLDLMIDQVTSESGDFRFSKEKDSEINFVKIADSLPRFLFDPEKNQLGLQK